jgi:hypothetical protein
MIVMQKARSLENGISDAIYSAMVLVCASTSIAAPIVLGVMLQRGKFAGNNGSSEQEG